MPSDPHVVNEAECSLTTWRKSPAFFARTSRAPGHVAITADRFTYRRSPASTRRSLAAVENRWPFVHVEREVSRRTCGGLSVPGLRPG